MTAKPKKRRVPHEEKVQKAVVNFLRGLRKVGVPIKFIHPANELLRTKALRLIYWALGVEAGAPDLVIFLRGGKTIFIELKVKGNYLEDSQKEWQESLTDMGFEHYVVTAPSSNMQGLAYAVHAVAGILNKHGLKV